MLRCLQGSSYGAALVSGRISEEALSLESQRFFSYGAAFVSGRISEAALSLESQCFLAFKAPHIGLRS